MDKKTKAAKITSELKKLFPNPKTPLTHSNPWELYVAVALSAQQTDVGVNKVTETLFKKYKKLDDYVQVPFEEFDQDIKSRKNRKSTHGDYSTKRLARIWTWHDLLRKSLLQGFLQTRRLSAERVYIGLVSSFSAHSATIPTT
jgi:endonuclease III